MSNKAKTHWPTAFTAYFVAGLLASVGGFAVRHHSFAATWHAFVAGALAELIGLAVLVAAGWYLHDKVSAVRWLSVGLKKFWHVLLAWTGAGLLTFGIAEVAVGPSTSSIPGAILSGPLAFLTYPNKFFIALMFLVETVTIVELLRESKLANHKGGEGSVVAVFRSARELVHKGAGYAPAVQPEDAHFVETTEPVSRYVIPNGELGQRVSFGVAHLAPAPGKKKIPVELGLPDEGSALLLGAPGSGKTLMAHRMILNTVKADPDKGIRPIKWIVTSVKPRDIAGVVTPYLRSLGMKIDMWDLTGKTSGADTYGDPVRWAPNSSCTNYDKAKKMAKRIALSGRDADAQGGNNKFWLEQCTNILACALLASNLRRAEHEKTLRWAKTWDDPNAVDVGQILLAHGDGDGAADALRDWEEVRSSVLEKRPDGTWADKAGSGENTVTGNNLKMTLTGLMAEIATQAAYDATAKPNFVPREWIRTEGSSALFLIGNMHEEGMTRSLFAPALSELLHEAAEFANEHDDERLPFQLVIVGDELANLAPIEDLEKWFATFRSAGIQFLAIAQSFAALEQVYSPTKARILLDTSAAVVVLSGINDPDLIKDLNAMGGSKRIELNDDNVTTHALIEGQQLMALRAPNAKTGAPGNAIMVMNGGVAMISVPLWTTEARYDDRGTVMPQHRSATEKLREARDPWQRRRGATMKSATKVWNRVTSRRTQRDSTYPPVPVARPLVPRDETSQEQPGDSTTSRPEASVPSSAFNPLPVARPLRPR